MVRSSWTRKSEFLASASGVSVGTAPEVGISTQKVGKTSTESDPLVNCNTDLGCDVSSDFALCRVPCTWEVRSGHCELRRARVD